MSELQSSRDEAALGTGPSRLSDSLPDVVQDAGKHTIFDPNLVGRYVDAMHRLVFLQARHAAENASDPDVAQEIDVARAEAETVLAKLEAEDPAKAAELRLQIENPPSVEGHN